MFQRLIVLCIFAFLMSCSSFQDEQSQHAHPQTFPVQERLTQ